MLFIHLLVFLVSSISVVATDPDCCYAGLKPQPIVDGGGNSVSIYIEKKNKRNKQKQNKNTHTSLMHTQYIYIHVYTLTKNTIQSTNKSTHAHHYIIKIQTHIIYYTGWCMDVLH